MKGSDVGGPQLREPNVVASGLKIPGYALAQICLTIVLTCGTAFAVTGEGSTGKYWAKVVFQNCAGGGGRLDLGIMHRFQNTELSDWLRAPRGLKILNGMTWILPPVLRNRSSGSGRAAST
jgi:hypothetical protein